MTDIVWLAYVAKRDLAGAEELVSAMPEPDTSGGHAIDTYFQRLAYQIQVHWLLRQDEELADVLVAAREAIDEFPTPDGVAFDYVMNLDMALVTAAEGKTEETERRIWRLLNGAEKDLAARVLYLHEACWRLGMAGAAEAAVNCIRTGLGEPSYVMPFLEPYLPYYDAIREDPAFVALLAELDDEVSNP
jgi:hypothetical protein